MITQLSIDDHPLEATEVDGIDTELGGLVDAAWISAGMRYLLIVNITVGSPGPEFYILAERAGGFMVSPDRRPCVLYGVGCGYNILRGVLATLLYTVV